jgi:hypothetical protein
MWSWLEQNKTWVFSGAGLTALGLLWWLVTKFWPKREASSVIAPVTMQAPTTTMAPVINMNPTINLSSARPPEPPKVVSPPAPAAPTPRPNLCIEATKIGKITLEGDIWTLRPNSRSHNKPERALLADISNVPTDEVHAAKAAIRAAVRLDYGGQVRTYSPLPWLEEYTNVANLETGARKTVVLAVGEDSKTGPW